MIIIAVHNVLNLEVSKRLSDYLIGVFDEIPTRKGIKKAILNQQVLVNGKSATTAQWVLIGDIIQLIEKSSAPPKEFELTLEIPYEDDFLAVVIKPSGIPVSGNLYKTLYNALGDNLKTSIQQDRLRWPLPIHRLDTATSGLVIIAKTHSARVELGRMLENKSIQKRYRAILQGTLLGNGTIDASISDKKAISNYSVIENIPTLKDTSLTLVDFYPITGRTHQLRIHASSIGHPIVGDKLYKANTAMKTDKGLFLCAVEVQFIHPVTQEFLKVEISQPAKFDSYIEREKRRVKKYS